jgi:DNA-binding CsgD family transcriptional regulator
MSRATVLRLVETPAARGHDGVVSWPRRSVPAETSELLERGDQLAVLMTSLQETADSGHGRVVLVSGDAGVGKTALLRAFGEGMPRSGRLRWAACDPLFTPRPLGPLFDLAREGDGELAEAIAGGGRPHEIAAAVVQEAADTVASVLVIEDVHWADEATLDVIALCARRARTVPLLLVLSYRDEQVGRSQPLRVLLGELPGAATVCRIELEGLSPGAVAHLAGPAGVDPDELFDRTAGNPFFVTEVLAAGTQRLPTSIRDAVLARVTRLPSGARTVLDAVAIMPGPTEVWLLDGLVEDGSESLEECLRSGMLTPNGSSVGFRHDLARLAIETALAPDVRVALHARALARLADPPAGAPDLARLAHHAEAAGDTAAVLRYTPAAARHAHALGAPREAQHQYRRALRFATDVTPVVRAELLERFAGEGYLTDMREEAVGALDEALAIHLKRCDPLKVGDLHQQRSSLLTCTGRTVEARDAAHEAIAVLEPLRPGRELARAYAGLSRALMLGDDVTGTREWGQRAIALADATGDTEALVGALNNVGVVELSTGDDAGMEKLERSLRLARQAGLGPDVGRAYINITAALGRLGRWAQLGRYLRPGITYCREQGLDAWLRCLQAAQAEADLALGHWDQAEATATMLLNAPPDGVVGPRHSALVVLALLRARRGQDGHAPLLQESRQIAEANGDLQFLGIDAVARAEVAWLEGRADTIAVETQRAFDLAAELDEPMFLGQLACWRWRAGALHDPPPGADRVYQRQITGGWRENADHWRAAGCRYDAALALIDSADPEALREAALELRALGAKRAQAIAARGLRKLGERGLPSGPRPRTRSNPAGLTARELEVLPLLAEGLRNAEIANRLIVSTKTVDHHVSAILRKLAVSTRGQAVAKAAELGLAAPSR